MGRAIFISYRRDDTEGEAGRLFDDLVRSFDENSVFMDVSGINPGVDFRKAIDDNVASCGVLLAIIGPAWTTIADPSGTRRLDNPNDFVRLEIGSALARDIPVIPVLVHDAKMPRPDQLPQNLKDLAFRNSVEVTHARWNSDVELLIAALGRYVSPSAAGNTKPVHATVPVQLPPPTPTAPQRDPARRSSLPLVLGIVAAAILALGIVGYLILHPHGNDNRDLAFVGTWTNPAPESQNGLVKLEISGGGMDPMSIHAWGQCGQLQCDWGSQPATVTNGQAQATWKFGAAADGTGAKRTAAVVIEPQDKQLSVTVSNSYADHPSNKHQFTFVKSQ